MTQRDLAIPGLHGTPPARASKKTDEALAKVAAALVVAGDGQIAALLASGEVRQVACDGDEPG